MRHGGKEENKNGATWRHTIDHADLKSANKWSDHSPEDWEGRVGIETGFPAHHHWWGRREASHGWYDSGKMRPYQTDEGTRSRGPPQMATTFANMGIAGPTTTTTTPPPKLGLMKYETLHKELWRRRYMSGRVDGHVPIAQLASRRFEDTLKTLLGDHMEVSRVDRWNGIPKRF